jgi:hypothetical protein
MTGRRLTRRGLFPGTVVSAMGTNIRTGSVVVVTDSAIFDLSASLVAAERRLATAMARLARAERRLAAVRNDCCVDAAVILGRDTPDWYRMAEADHEVAGGAVEAIYRRMATTPTRTREGLAIKLRVLATLYGEDLAGPVDGDEADAFAHMLRSIIADVAGEGG